MMKIKRLICYIKAVPIWARNGFNKDFFCPHLFVDGEEFAAPAFMNKKTQKPRVADGYTHTIDEYYIPNAIFIPRRCKRCGYQQLDVKRIGEWVDNAGEKQIIMMYYNRRNIDGKE